MGPEKTLHVTMLGGFSLSYGGKTIDDSTRAMKLWTLLEYLITFRNREISQNELIELLWPEAQSENPINALKTMVHRLRAVLTELGYVDGREMILQKRGSYTWNVNLPARLDIEQFESLCREAEEPGSADEQALACYMAAISLYKGDFLPRSNLEVWATPIHTYYHIMYINAVRQAIELLKKHERNQDIVDICSVALGIDAYDEYLHYNLILALYKLGKQQAAINQYESMSDLFFNYFGITPSEEMAALYREIIKANQHVEKDLQIIREQLREKEAQAGAFFCKYEFFKDIYRVQARAVARSGMSIYICLITVTDKQGRPLEGKAINTVMTRLGVCVRESLRKGDVYSRYSVAQYIMMLPSVTYEDSRRVIERILNRYRGRHSILDASFNYNMEPVEPML